jgi:hypothetical protein
MTTFDPAEVRKAVAEFTPRRPQKFQDLILAREVIVELRQKSASYHSIADLLTHLTRRGLAPRKKSQTCAGALTPKAEPRRQNYQPRQRNGKRNRRCFQQVVR